MSAESRKPYEHQLEDVDWIARREALGHKGHWLTHEPGVGKSVSALLWARRAARPKAEGPEGQRSRSRALSVLVICPASVRRAWSDRVAEWLPECSYARVSKGDERKYMSKPEVWRQQVLRTADVVITSSALLDTLDEERDYDLVVLDEMHECVSAKSAIYEQIRALRLAQPQATFLGLSGTPLSTDPVQVWSLLDMFWPGMFGRRARNHGPPRAWLERFCEAKESEYSYSGWTWSGLREDARNDLQRVLGAVSRRVLREDLGDVLPPVDFRPLDVAADEDEQRIVVEKVRTMLAESGRCVLFTWHRDPARDWYKLLCEKLGAKVETMYVDGEMPPDERHAKLEALSRVPSALLVATGGSMGVGVDLTAFGQYLIAEPTGNAHDVVQVDGRFRRLSAVGKPAAIGHMLFQEGRDDGARRLLVGRMKTYEALLRTAKGNQEMCEALQSTDAGAFERSLDALLAGYRGDAGENDE